MDGFKIQGEWDANKDQENLVKHGVSFTTALTVLRDPLAVTRFDADHSESEERWFTIGRTPLGQCLVVFHTWRDVAPNAAAVRIISARKAAKSEQRLYEEGELT